MSDKIASLSELSEENATDAVQSFESYENRAKDTKEEKLSMESRISSLEDDFQRLRRIVKLFMADATETINTLRNRIEKKVNALGQPKSNSRFTRRIQ